MKTLKDKILNLRISNKSIDCYSNYIISITIKVK